MEIRHALHHLGEITGEITTNDLLENIFSKFCLPAEGGYWKVAGVKCSLFGLILGFQKVLYILLGICAPYSSCQGSKGAIPESFSSY